MKIPLNPTMQKELKFYILLPVLPNFQGILFLTLS